MHESTLPRHHDLAMRYREAFLNAPSTASRLEILKAACDASPRGYYISFDYALRMIRFVRRHPEKSLRLRRRLYWLELAGKVDACMEAEKVEQRHALARVLATESPSMSDYTPRSASNALRHHRLTLRREGRPRRPLK